jgi:uncharacterized membrane protein YczE
MITIAMGITLATKSGLGISPSTSAQYALANWLGTPFSATVFGVYMVMVAAQMLIRRRGCWKHLLQIPSSVVFTSFLSRFGTLVDLSCTLFWQKLILSVLGAVLVGVGFAVMVNMQIIPNPPDGLIFEVSEATGKDLGFWKNAFDISFVILAGIMDMISDGKLISIGLGTLVAMIITGRVVYLCNRSFCRKLVKLAGLDG